MNANGGDPASVDASIKAEAVAGFLPFLAAGLRAARGDNLEHSFGQRSLELQKATPYDEIMAKPLVEIRKRYPGLLTLSCLGQRAPSDHRAQRVDNSRNSARFPLYLAAGRVLSNPPIIVAP
jgi:hypothetical protein